MFLELVRKAGERDPGLAAAALRGLAQYETMVRPAPRPARTEIARVGPASLRDHGGAGPPAVLIPSLINPPDILDLDDDVSLASAVAAMGRRVLLLDWGPAAERSDLDVAGHVEHLLVPLLATLDEPPGLIGYCLGGTMAIAAASLVPAQCVVTLAAPWRFHGYPPQSRDSLGRIWAQSKAAADRLGALPTEVLQAAFWSIDAERTVAKFAEFGRLDPASAEARRFVTLEDWANRGEPLPCPAAGELIEDFFLADRPGKGEWTVAGRSAGARPDSPVLHCTASRDRITPAETAPTGDQGRIEAGHVGMIVGSARSRLHHALEAFFDRLVD